jgi:hypothetical protein
MASRTISTAAETIFPRNVSRKSWIVSNEDAAIDVYLKREQNETLSVSATDHDHRLAGGSSLALSTFIDGGESVKDRWTVVAASGTPRLSFFETEDVMR